MVRARPFSSGGAAPIDLRDVQEIGDELVQPASFSRRRNSSMKTEIFDRSTCGSTGLTRGASPPASLSIVDTVSIVSRRFGLIIHGRGRASAARTLPFFPC